MILDPDEILNLVKFPRYCEAAAPGRAIDRLIKLAEDGWRLVYLVVGDAMERAIECAASFAKHDVPFHIIPDADQPVIGEAPVGLVLVRRRFSGGDCDTGALVVVVAASPSEMAADAERQQPPLSFSMSGLAG
jgi:siroheme synthase